MIGQLFIAYLVLNAVVVVAVLMLALLQRLQMKAGVRLQLHYSVLALVFLISAGAMMIRGGELLQPMVKVWSPSEPSQVPAVKAGERIIIKSRTRPTVPADYFFLFGVGLGLGAGAAGLLYLLGGQWRLRKIIKQSFRFKQIGSTQIAVSDAVSIPFSYHTLTTAWVVLPGYLLGHSENMRMAVAHELQHHRQGDTKWIYVFALLRALCFFNPFVHFWNQWIGEIQEFACDEALVGRQGFQAQAYARCLIQVAETAWVEGGIPDGATGMILLNRGNLLNRRIQSMFKQQKAHGRRAWAAALALIAITLTTAAFATKGLVHDRRISMAQAQEMAHVARKGSQFPIVVNQEVLKFLNHYMGTPEGRQKMREGLRRMEAYRPLVTAKINEYKAPPELMAIPLIESGYQNLPDRNVRGWGAGLWMFIASTARNYGLKVNADVDERLNESLLTDAAMRYLLANQDRFNDWQLSALAYNWGERAVENAIQRLGTRDPWVLVRDGGFKGEPREYLAKLMAGIIVMKNPDSVQ